jgi:hypothetical protein
LKETRLKVLQGIHGNNMEANQQPFSPTKHQPPFSFFFNHNDTKTSTSRKDMLLFNSKDENKVDHPKVNSDISSLDPRNNQNRPLVKDKGKTTYKGNNTTTKGGISSSLSLVSKIEDNKAASKKSTLDDQQESPVDNSHSTLIKEVEPNIQACISKKEDDSNNGVLNTTESNTTLNKDDFKPPLPKRRPLKVDISILESPKQTNKNEDATLDALSGKKSTKHSLRLGIQTNAMSKEKLPKSTTVFNGIKTISSESSINATSPESNVSNVSDHTWPSSPKKEFLVVSPRMGNHQIKPHVFHRELPSPRGDKIKKVGPPPPLPKRPKPSSRPPTPKKDIYASSNQNNAIAKNSDWRRRLDMPPPPLIINRDRFSHSTRAASLRKDIPTRNPELKVPQLDDEVPTPGVSFKSAR